MNTKKHIFSKVVSDRKSGLSLGEISRKHKLAKSTVSLWCKNIKLSKEAERLIKENWLRNTSSARAKGTITNKQKRIERIRNEYDRAREIIGYVTRRDLFIVGVALYWAEGSKKETGSGFSFINSDPKMVHLIFKWLVDIMDVKKDELIINLAINISHKEREEVILKYWSNLLDYNLNDFGNTTFIKTAHLRSYNNHIEYFGMIRIKVKSSAWLRRRVLGMIKVINEQLPV